MSVRQFAAYRSPGKGRVFALLDDPADTLEVVTTLGADDLALTDSLVAELNAYLAEREDKALDEVLRQLPEAVRRAVTSFLRQHCEPEPGTYGVHGAIRRLRLVYFDDRTPDFEEYVDAAYMIGLGVRVTNEVDPDGEIGWVVELLSDEPFVPASAEPRAWALPEGVAVLSTWTSQEQTIGNPVNATLSVARTASREGHWVRFHSLSREEGDSENDVCVSEFVVDTFDAPIPASQH